MTEPPADAPRPVLGRAFWLLMALAAVSLLAGGAIGFMGPKLFPPHPATPGALGAAPKAR
jgi:hypothetical protein